MIKSVEFRKKRADSWKKLERLLDIADGYRGLKALSPQQLEELGNLYRMASSSLQVLRSISLDKSLNLYLENLVTRAYFTIYARTPKEVNPISRFFLVTFPSKVRQYFLCHFVAFAIIMLSVVAGFWVTLKNPGNYFAFVDKRYAQGRTPFSGKEKLEKVLKSGRNLSGARKTYFASYLFTHNTRVGFLTFSTGIALGIPTFFLLVKNGALLGAMGAAYHMHDLSPSFWAWILAHGITEILAIILCAGAGFIIAMGVIKPGKYGRLENLRIAGKDAGLTVMGVVPMFFIAGLIEGFFRQTSLPDLMRYIFAFITLVAWIFYFGFLRLEKR